MSKLSLFEGRSRLILLWMLIALFINQGEVFAGITGKISGRVVDAKTQEPMPSVNVVIRGTSLGAASDVDGYYFIINIPPGTYNVVASMVGFETSVQTDVVVTSDHTTPLNFALNSTVIEGKEVVVVATREIVKKDVSSSVVTATSAQMDAVPMVRDMMAFVNMQAGFLNDAVRGGGLDQVGYIVDGLVSVDNRTNSPLMQVNMSSVSEVSITKGGFNAEYGNIRSGLISVVTRDPDPAKYHLSIDARYSPARLKHDGASIVDPNNYYLKPFLDPSLCWGGPSALDSVKRAQYTDQYQYSPASSFNGWNDPLVSSNKGMTPNQARQLFQWQHGLEITDSLGRKAAFQNPHQIQYGDKPDFLFDGSFSGGVPIIGKYLGDLSFLISHKSDYQAFALPTSRDYYVNTNTQVKLTSHITSSMKLSVEGSYGEINTVANSAEGGSDNDFVSSGQDIIYAAPYNSFNDYRTAWWPDALVPFNKYQSMVGLSFDHMISNSTFYQLRISAVQVKNSASPWGPDAYRSLDSLGHFGGVTVNEIPWGVSAGSSRPQNTEDKADFGGIGGSANDHGAVKTLNIKFDITSQLDRYNQIKAGLDYTYDDLHTQYGLTSYSQSLRSFETEWNHYPSRLGAYIQDKLEFEGMIANVGVRLDYNDPNCDWFSFANDASPDHYSPYFLAQGQKIDSLFLGPKFSKASGHLKISPRIGISHPISENVKLFFSYGHFYSMPSTSSMYAIGYGINNKNLQALGNPNLDLPRTVAYELGVDWDIANVALLHIAGYYKNTQDQINTVTYAYMSGNNSYVTYNNGNYADVRGFEIQLERNFGAWVTGLANYTYEVVQSGNLGKNLYNEDIYKEAGYVDPNVIRAQIRPYARVAAQFRTPAEWGPEVLGIQPLSDWMISPRFNWQAGSYATINPENILGPDNRDPNIQNNAQWKAAWYLDLRISKRLSIANINMEIFADINNVLNNKFIDANGFANGLGDQNDYLKSLHLALYNNPKFAGYRDSGKGWYIPGNDQLGDVKSADKPYINMPNRDFLTFSNLRYITFGIRVNI